MRTITIDGIDYSKHLIDGFVVSETLTEELDSANIILTTLKKTNFDPFQKVVITENNKIYYFIVDTYVESKISNNPELYEYNLNVISETKVLERIILPNLKITKPVTDSYIKKMGNFLDFIINHYVAPKYYLELDATLKAELNKYQAPEWAWVSPNVKQVFNDLLSTLDKPKLVKVNNGIVGAVELSLKGNEITSQFGKIGDDNYEASKDYVNNLVIDAKNVLPYELNTQTAPVVSFRSNDKAYLTTDDLELYIENARIEKLDKVIVTLLTGYTDENGNTYNKSLDIDITKYIYEETLYNQLSVDSRDYALYFTRGGNTIKGFTYSKQILGLSVTPAIKVIINAEIMNYNAGSSALNGGTYDLYLGELRDLKFTIWYQNIGESRIKVYRDDLKKYDLSLQDNQTSSYINIVAFMQSEREKVNRLGNDIRTISWIFKNYDDIPKLNDYIGDYILAKREIAHSPNKYIFKGTFSKNYIQKNLYYGLQSRTRFTNFLLADQSILRNENITTNIYFTTENTTANTFSKRKLCTYIARYYTGRPILSGGIKQIVGTSTFQDKTTKSYYLQPSVYSLGYGALISFKYFDNINVGMKIDKNFVLFGTKYAQKYVSYTDSNGELTSVKFDLYSQYDSKYLNSEQIEEDYDETFEYPDIINNYLDEKTLEYTIIDGIYKDNGEVLQYDLQFDFKAKNDVVLGSSIGLLNAFTDFTLESNYKISDMRTYTRAYTSKLRDLKIYVSTSEKYKHGDTTAKGDVTDLVIDSYPFIAWDNGGTANQITVGVYNSDDTDTTISPDTSTWQSWALATKDGELIMAVNRNDETNTISTTIYVTTD